MVKPSSLPETMRAVIFNGAYKISTESIPTPEITSDDQVILKVELAGLCGSDLHWYRGNEGTETGFVMGHEAIGMIVKAGKGITKFKIGDRVIAPFSLSCGNCYYCNLDLTSRCLSAIVPGCPALNGAQAEYYLLPQAQSSLFPFPRELTDAGIEDLGLLLTDILPTGRSVAWNGWKLAGLEGGRSEERGEVGEGGVKGFEKRKICVVIGCGPVGLCAITSSLGFFHKTYATDLNTSRLPLASKHGATALPISELIPAILAETDGRGPDVVLEVVGHQGALKTALEIVRPGGVVSSCGVYNGNVTIDGGLLYGKNVKMQFGRCSVRAHFDASLEILLANKELFKGFVEKRVQLDQAGEYYRKFEKGEVSKTLFVMPK